MVGRQFKKIDIKDILCNFLVRTLQGFLKEIKKLFAHENKVALIFWYTACLHCPKGQFPADNDHLTRPLSLLT